MTHLTTPLRRRARTFLTLISLVGLALIFWPSRSLRSDNFIFYLPNSSRAVPVQTIGQVNYLPLLQVLNLVGKVNGMTVTRDSLKVYFENTELEFHLDDKKLRIKKAKVKLSDPVRVDNGQWMVPVSFLESVLPQLIHQSIGRLGARRVFIGDTRPNAFTVHLEQVPNGARVIVQFADKVNVRTASSNGKWIVFLGDKPVAPTDQKFVFQDPYISNVQFDDHDGVPKLIVTPAVEGLNFYSKVDESGKTLQAELLKPPPVVAQQPPPAPVPAASQPTPPAGAQPSSPAGAAPTAAAQGVALPVVVLDAGHGAEDSGARGANGVLEKELVAQLVARVRSALLASKKYKIVLTRLGDVNPSADQRDATANGARPSVFLTFHAGNLGVQTSRVMLFTYQPSSTPPPPEAKSRESFIPWSTAQLNHAAKSHQLAEALHSELAKISGSSVSPPTLAPVRVLRSVNAPAVAVEVGSLAPEVDPTSLTSSAFQGEIANAIVRALEAFEGKS